ncbi:MAG: hypothetical protein ACYDCX_04650 [Acidithiobacillus sp.]
MTAVQIVIDIVQSGGSIYVKSGRLKVKGIPAALVPAVRLHKAELLALLSPSVPDPYTLGERQAIQAEVAEISDLPDKTVLSLKEQAVAMVAGYAGDWQRTADDLRVVANNPVLAALVVEQIMAPPQL